MPVRLQLFIIDDYVDTPGEYICGEALSSLLPIRIQSALRNSETFLGLYPKMFEFQAAAQVNVKSKGKMETYNLVVYERRGELPDLLSDLMKSLYCRESLDLAVAFVVRCLNPDDFSVVIKAIEEVAAWKPVLFIKKDSLSYNNHSGFISISTATSSGSRNKQEFKQEFQDMIEGRQILRTAFFKLLKDAHDSFEKDLDKVNATKKTMQETLQEMRTFQADPILDSQRKPNMCSIL
ncbi:hypothetical protein ACMFMG_012030 [Clarireedia jacksonii]